MKDFETFLTPEFLLSSGVALAVIALFALVNRVLKKKADEKRENFFRRLYAALIKPIQTLFFVSVLFTILRQGGWGLEDNFWLNKSYVIIMIAITTWLAVNLTRFAGDRILRQFNMGVADNLRARSVHTQIRVIQRLVIALLIMLGIGAALMTFEEIRSLGVSLLASAGVAGIVLGFAAQKTIGNFFTGIQIAITQPIRLDDSVVVEGEWGWIEEINLTYVVVKLWDLRRLVLPISYFVENPFQNWTRKSAEIIGTVFIHVDYTMPIAPIREELDRILEDNDLWNGNVKVVQVTESKERTMEVRILVSAKNAPTAWDLRCDVREKIITFIQDNYPDKLPRVRAEIKQQEQNA
jgi:small-conductance mechanosensitive channel